METTERDAENRSIRLLIIHRNRLYREALVSGLVQQPDFTVVGTANEANSVLTELNKLSPDLIIVGYCMQARGGFRHVRALRDGYPRAKILMVDMTDLESDVLSCIEAGAAGFLQREASMQDLFEQIRSLVQGATICSPRLAAILFERIADAAREKEGSRGFGLVHLTRRELEIVSLIGQGLVNKEIAVRLGIELQTVKNHVHNLLDKLQLKDRREVARYARDVGLL